MLTIELKTVDQLHTIVTELDVITFLQHLVAHQAEQSHILSDVLQDMIPEAHYQLLDWQTGVLERLNALIYNEDFFHTVSNNADNLE